MKLTQTSLSKLKLSAGSTDQIFFDDDFPGFGVRIRAGGSRKFVLHYRLGDAQRRYTIGSASVLTLDQARQKARKALVAVGDGKDPQADQDASKAAAGLIFGKLVAPYLETCERSMSAGHLAQTKAYLENHWKPLHKSAVGAITRQMVAAELTTIEGENGPIAANRARSALSTFFAWLIGEGMRDDNPVIGTNRRAEVARDRVLTEAELVAIWRAAPATAFGRIVRLLMLTGQRRDEIGSLAWSEIRALDDSGKALVALPAERTKNGRPHDVPLSAAAAAILADHPRVIGRALVFGEGEGGFSGWSKAKAELDKASGVTGWTLHDLRRSAATHMADSVADGGCGVAPHVVEAILNHISGHKAGVAGIYNRSAYAAEKRDALDAWAARLAVLVAQAEGTNVTPIWDFGGGRRRAAGSTLAVLAAEDDDNT